MSLRKSWSVGSDTEKVVKAICDEGDEFQMPSGGWFDVVVYDIVVVVRGVMVDDVK